MSTSGGRLDLDIDTCTLGPKRVAILEDWSVATDQYSLLGLEPPSMCGRRSSTVAPPTLTWTPDAKLGQNAGWLVSDGSGRKTAFTLDRQSQFRNRAADNHAPLSSSGTLGEAVAAPPKVPQKENTLLANLANGTAGTVEGSADEISKGKSEVAA